jgi:hypothetical protein
VTESEELVYRLCTKSFLSLWSYPNPRGKRGKELCDILVVCEPDIIIFSVKEAAFKDTGNKVAWERRREKTALGKELNVLASVSCLQILQT